MNEQPLDSELASTKLNLIPATRIKRFLNLLIDYIGAILFGGIIMMFLYITETLDVDEKAAVAERLIGILTYLLYYIIMENFFRGKTLGKLITKTRAVDQQGRHPGLKTVLLRSLSRIVPFEPFSFLTDDNSGWHDYWTHTMVIDEKKSSLPVAE